MLLAFFSVRSLFLLKSHVTLKLPLAFFRHRRTWPSRSPMTVAFHSPEGTAVFQNQRCLVTITVLMTIVVKEAFAPRSTSLSHEQLIPEYTLHPRKLFSLFFKKWKASGT